MYWWDMAALALRNGRTERFGFITTNSLTQIFNRRVLQRHMETDENPISLSFAIPNHPLVDSTDGAAVRVAMTVAQPVKATGLLEQVISEQTVNGEEAHEVKLLATVGEINSDLSVGADLSSAVVLKANEGMSFQGVKLVGAGFLLPESKGLQMQGQSGKGVIRPYRTGKDLTARSRNVMVIDLFGLSESEVYNSFPELYQHLLQTVKPERDQVQRAAHRERWWIHGEARSVFRRAVQGLPRYIATSEVAKHRIFTFLESEILPDGSLMVITLNDALYLGILSSRIHGQWSLSAGGTLEDRPRYNNSRCFIPFPFPDATPQQQARIRDLAEQLDAHRKRQQAAHVTLTLTDLYNVVEKLRGSESLNTKEQAINQQGLASVVLSLHQQIDAAVANAYGWPDDLPDSEILSRLVLLNHKRAAEEAAGHIRYLRPSYQAPNQQQLGIDLPTSVSTTAAPVVAASQQEWPKELAQQMQAVRDTVQQAGVSLSTKQVAVFFQRIRPEKIQPLLDTLTTLALLRQTPEGAYAV